MKLYLFINIKLYASVFNVLGNNCNECISYYYRPSTVLPADPLACRPCVCDPAGAGIGRNPTTGLFGDCISNAELAVARQVSLRSCSSIKLHI